MNSERRWFIGLMSGTSLDGIDGVLADLSESKCRVALHVSAPFAPDLRAEFLALNQSGADELHRAALAANALARAYAHVVQTLLRQADLSPRDILAIGAHGQTVRHRPQAFDGTGYTLQINNPALLAEECGITVAADFRSRDVAAGGQGAPLVPAFHRCMFGQSGRTVGVLNIGGISNLSILRANGTTLGFDCGPGNALMDHWCQKHTGQLFDSAGAWARRGRVHPALLTAMLSDPFLAAPPPKSTGRDLFNADWLNRHVCASAGGSPQDVQATLAEFTARACAQHVCQHAPESNLLIVCGGGARNTYLMERLQALLPGVAVEPSDRHGLPSQQVEAAAFAWLACQCLEGRPASAPDITGARGARILGALYRA